VKNIKILFVTTAIFLPIGTISNAQDRIGDWLAVIDGVSNDDNLVAGLGTLSTVNAALENLSDLQELEASLDFLRNRAATLEGLKNIYNNQYVSLYSLGNGSAPIGDIAEAYQLTQEFTSRLDETLGSLKGVRSRVGGLASQIGTGVGTAAKYAGAVGDAVTILNAVNTFTDENSTLMDEADAVAGLSSIVVTTYAPATGGIVVAPIGLTIQASSLYTDKTRDVATGVLQQMQNDTDAFYDALRAVVLRTALENPGVSPEDVLVIASNDINEVMNDFAEMYGYEGSLHRAVYGSGITRLASGLGNFATGGAKERLYLSNSDLFLQNVNDPSTSVARALSGMSSSIDEKLRAISDTQSQIAALSGEIGSEMERVTKSLETVFDSLDVIGASAESFTISGSRADDQGIRGNVEGEGGIDSGEPTSELVVTENDNGDPVLGNNAGTSIVIEPTGPTPEEIAEAERLAELRRQEISRLEAERTEQFEVKLAREVQIQNIDNELALLEFGDQQEALNALSLVTVEEQRLRAELNDTGLSAADQQLLQDLLVYQGTLEDELDRIGGRILSLETDRETLQDNLNVANSIIVANSNQLNALNYDYNQFTIPTTSAVLIDWSSYDYELPVFNATDPAPISLANVVGHAVSVPTINESDRVKLDLVSEDNAILTHPMSALITELRDESGELLDGFTHLFVGSGSDEYGKDWQWIYGEASTPEQFALRTGNATFNGGLMGYYADGSEADHTLYQGSVSGDLELNVDFEANRLTGEGQLGVDNAAISEVLAFSLSESTISGVDNGSTRSLGFSAGATLENERDVSGSFGGTFYGENTSEAAGSFAFSLSNGLVGGIWAAGEAHSPSEDSQYSVMVSYSDLSGSITDRSDDGIGKVPELGDTFALTVDGTATTVTSILGIHSGDYNYASMGEWTGGAPTSPINSGYWVAGEAVYRSVLYERTGSATFSGDIIGDFVPFSLGMGDVVREDATGTIRLVADFSTDQIAGEMQFVSASTATDIIPLTSLIASSGFFYESNDVVFDRPVYGYGFSGEFFGPFADELGGGVWAVTEAGSYNGVFRAGEDLSFGGFVTPTTSDTIDYSNYRGIAAYVGISDDNGNVTEDLEFVALETINSSPKALFENTSTSPDLLASTDTLGQSYSYSNWGSWENDGSALVNSVAGRDGTVRWIVYDPTIDLRTSGQATYSGDAVGSTSNGGNLAGNIQLTADFGNDTVTGDMSLELPNGYVWASTSFDTTIRRDVDSSGFQGALTGSDVNSGTIFGGFAGPNAEEVGGGWQIDHSNGPDANGIFRAQN
jgi:hypothetical protein